MDAGRSSCITSRRAKLHRKAASTGEVSGTHATGTECWKCGMIGHRKDQCKKKQCFYCHGYGHRQRDCPKKAAPTGGVSETHVTGIECWRCGEIGHRQDQCKKKAAPTCGISETHATGTECWRCGEIGHRQDQCKKKQCFYCHGYGHRQFECSKKTEREPTNISTPHVSQVGGSQRGLADEGSEGERSSSIIAPTQLYSMQLDAEPVESSIVRGLKMTVGPTEEQLPVVYESKDSVEDPEEEYEEYIEEVSEEDMESDPEEDLEEEESNAEPNKETGNEINPEEVSEEDMESDPEEDLEEEESNAEPNKETCNESNPEEVSEEDMESNPEEDLEEEESNAEPNEETGNESNPEEDLEEGESNAEPNKETGNESNPEEDLEEGESNAELNKETGFANKVLKDEKTFSKTTDEAAVSKALVLESSLKERRRLTRWDLQPKQDREMGEGDNGNKIRKTRWGSDVSELKGVAPIQLPEPQTEFGESESDAELRKLKQKLVVINRKIRKVHNGKSMQEESRRKHEENLVKEKQNLLGELRIKNKLRAHQVCNRKGERSRKVYVPAEEYPSYNFIGLLLGPRGNTMKKMQDESGASIKLRGKGSHNDPKADDSDDEDLHVCIKSYTQSSLDAAVAMVEKLLIPLDDRNNPVKQAQLAELFNLKGSNSNACNVCNEAGHKSYACPNKKSTFEIVTACAKCGSFSHLISNCPLNTKANPIKVINEASLYVGHLPQTVTENWLKERFCAFGKIINVRVIMDLTTGLSQGYGFVNFESPIDAAMAVKHMNGYQMEGKTLAVRVAGLPPPQNLPVSNPLLLYPRPPAISAYTPSHMGTWRGPPGPIISPRPPPHLGMLVPNPVPPYPRPAAISQNITSQMGPWSSTPGLSQNMDPVGQYNPTLLKAMVMSSHFESSYMYNKNAPHSASGSSQFIGDPDYHGSSSLFPGDPDYRGSSSLFTGDFDFK